MGRGKGKGDGEWDKAKVGGVGERGGKGKRKKGEVGSLCASATYLYSEFHINTHD